MYLKSYNIYSGTKRCDTQSYEGFTTIYVPWRSECEKGGSH